MLKKSLFTSKWGFRFTITFITILSCFLLVRCKNLPAEKELPVLVDSENVVSLTDSQMANTKIETVVLTEKDIANVLQLNGKIDVLPQNVISVSAPLGGYLKSTRLLPGIFVRKGETIAIMEDPSYIQLQQDYLQAKSALHFAELDYNRQYELNQSQASSDKVTQQAQAEMKRERILMNSLAQQLRVININPNKLTESTMTRTSPIVSQVEGFVSKVNINIGKYANPSDVLFELINLSEIQLNLKAYEKDLAMLHVGQTLIAYSNSEPEKKYPGQIVLISKDIGADGITAVRCKFKQRDNSLVPGKYMNAIIETNSALTYALPAESILSFEGKEYVFVQTAKNTYKMTPVTSGVQENGFVQILNHEAFAGKSIVSKNAYTLLMKLKNTEEE